MNAKQVALVHVARKELGLDDAIYRAVLEQCGGVESAGDLDSEGFERVMTCLTRMGFRSDWLKRTFGHRPGFASPGQVDLIRKLWRKWSDEGDETGLDHWLEHKFQVSALRFATPEIAHKVITALKAMTARKRGHA